MKTAVIAGATGLVGSELLRQLVESARYEKIIALTRRDFPFSHSKLEKIIVDFLNPGTALAGWRVDDVFCCLGTTMAKARSREKFYEVDFTYPLALANATLSLGAKQYLVVSALGADKGSGVYYNRVKGEVEEALRNTGFQTLHIFRPSLLLGPRSEKRAGEDAAKTLYKLFGFLIPKKYRAIDAHTVSRAMLMSASADQQGVYVHESQQIEQMVRTVLNS